MHELGIIVNINKTLAEVAADNGVSRISRVTLELGEVSGIVPELLEDCWKFYRKRLLFLKTRSSRSRRCQPSRSAKTAEHGMRRCVSADSVRSAAAAGRTFSKEMNAI